MRSSQWRDFIGLCRKEESHRSVSCGGRGVGKRSIAIHIGQSKHVAVFVCVAHCTILIGSNAKKRHTHTRAQMWKD